MFRLLWMLVAALLPAMAGAAMGDTVQSVEADRVALKASLRLVAGARFTVQEMQTSEGTLIREYISPQGIVFALTWQGHFMPNLRQTLGRFFAPYNNSVQAVRKGRSAVSVVTPELIVHSRGRPRAFFGLAYLPQALPAGVTLDELR